MDDLARLLEDARHRVLGQPDDLEVGPDLPQLPRDREVALCVAEADRAGNVERARVAPAHRPLDLPLLRALACAEELAEQQVDLDRVTHVGRVRGSFERDERPARCLGERRAARERRLVVLVAVDYENRAADPRGQFPRLCLVSDLRAQVRRDQGLGHRSRAPTSGRRRSASSNAAPEKSR